MKDFLYAPGNKLSQSHLKSDFSRWDEMCYCWVLDCQASLGYPFVEPFLTYELNLVSEWPNASPRRQVKHLYRSLTVWAHLMYEAQR